MIYFLKENLVLKFLIKISFYRKFLVSKKNQKDLEKVYFGLIYNLSKFDAKIFFISLNDDKPEMNDNLDNLNL